VAHLWLWFCDLHAARGGAGSNPHPITYPDIQAWSALSGCRPYPWEVSVIKRLDRIYLIALQQAESSDG